jgi:hypothetical protein
MSQQINLLPPRQTDVALAVAIGIFVVVVVGAVGYAEWSGRGLAESRKEAAQARDSLAQARIALAKFQAKRISESTAQLEAEIGKLRPRAGPAGEFIRQIDTGSLGTSSGYEAHFKALAAASDENVWITKVSIARGGGVVAVTGVGTTNEAVLAYARRATESFRAAGVTLHSLEMKPVTAVAGTPPVVQFTLS